MSVDFEPLETVAASEPSRGEALLKLRGLTSQVRLGNGEKLVTVANVNFNIVRGHSYAVVGKSGSGKTSLVSILGLLNNDFSGDYFYGDISVKTLSDSARSRVRAKNIGFVFQNYSLIKHLRVYENVELALLYRGDKPSRSQRKAKIMQTLEAVGLAEKAAELPSKLSGGEQQRVAIARALVCEPELLICDEPTGALDKQTGQLVLELLHNCVKNAGATLLLVTHDEDVAASCATVLRMDMGRIIDVSDAS
ncbi:ABC transporter ATP-binding protein [Canibacter sp. lx-72]|uniref:ABC transporter ATP-binding protein n=1 Tax=Canibacter zhuwentaonis TaxID=2837491 RepID=UPI001BDC8764|nr:ABC transporter ATP-binding protein [Canibacter zhuwentaonis]MBT1018705.1 ABC transporter ATP-binding protein [Canibacter zhuwentaonis]MBT1035874.1 ABC transporter ATP-binding protein [Canibacter zhuwentaonis]